MSKFPDRDAGSDETRTACDQQCVMCVHPFPFSQDSMTMLDACKSSPSAKCGVQPSSTVYLLVSCLPCATCFKQQYNGGDDVQKTGNIGGAVTA